MCDIIDSDHFPTFEDLERAALYSPPIRAALEHVRRGNCSIQTALIALALYYDRELVKMMNKEVKRLMNESRI